MGRDGVVDLSNEWPERDKTPWNGYRYIMECVYGVLLTGVECEKNYCRIWERGPPGYVQTSVLRKARHEVT